jgi:hypothetical protein
MEKQIFQNYTNGLEIGTKQSNAIFIEHGRTNEI